MEACEIAQKDFSGAVQPVTTARAHSHSLCRRRKHAHTTKSQTWIVGSASVRRQIPETCNCPCFYWQQFLALWAPCVWKEEQMATHDWLPLPLAVHLHAQVQSIAGELVPFILGSKNRGKTRLAMEGLPRTAGHKTQKLQFPQGCIRLFVFGSGQRHAPGNRLQLPLWISTVCFHGVLNLLQINW